MGNGGEPWHKSSGQSLLQVEQLLSCTQPSPHWREKTSVQSLCVLPDRDECEQPSTCRGQQCINTPGSYRCECKEGFAVGSRGQCEGEACCSLFPCPSKPPCVGLITSFSHHSMCPPGREEEPSLVWVPCAPLQGLPALCLQEGQAFLGCKRQDLPRSFSTSQGKSPTSSPCQFPILGGDAHAFHASLTLSPDPCAGKQSAGRTGCKDPGHLSPQHPAHVAQPGPFRAFVNI